MSATVAVFGAGIAGLTAAHELASRGYKVTVFDSAKAVGGKARSQGVRLGEGGPEFPGEHGFRFFPSYYRHLPASMTRIPRNPATANPGRALENLGADSVAANLVGVPVSGVARDDTPIDAAPRRLPKGPTDIVDMIEFYFRGMGMTPFDIGHLAARMLKFYTACDKRRRQQFEPQTWARFIKIDSLSDRAARTMRSFPKCLVAMDADQGSAFTIGNTSFLLMMDQTRSGDDVDRVLNGPTSVVWLDLWRQWLERLQPAVTFRLETPLRKLEFDPASGRLRGALVGDGSESVTADYYILAAPLDKAQPLVTNDMAQACGECRKLSRINLDGSLGWMVGAQFYLKNDVPVINGHVFYPDSPWALTSVSQAQLWQGDFRTRYGHGVVSGILSVDISDWSRTAPGTPAAKDCTREQIREHLVEQINGRGRAPILEPANVYGWHLDHDIEFGPDGKPLRNHSRLLIHPPGLLALRPNAETAIDNLLLASDYVATNTDLATMEGANEAARIAVNVILGREGDDRRCRTFDHLDLAEPAFIKAAKQIDEWKYDLGWNIFRTEAPTGTAESIDPFLASSLEEARALERTLRKQVELGIPGK